jgi:hypothetical protein
MLKEGLVVEVRFKLVQCDNRDRQWWHAALTQVYLGLRSATSDLRAASTVLAAVATSESGSLRSRVAGAADFCPSTRF